MAGLAIGCVRSAVVGAGRPTGHLPPPRNLPSPRTDVRDSCFGGRCGCPESKCRVTWCELVGMAYRRQRYVSVIIIRLQSPQSCWSYVTSFHAKSHFRCSREADTAANDMSVVSTFTPGTFSLAGIHMPYTDLLLLLLLCDLSSLLSGCTEIAVWRCSWWRV